MNNTDDITPVRERFRTFRNRMSRDIRMEKLLSGFILVLSIWLCVRIAGRILFIPELETISSAVLLTGILCTILTVYRTDLDRNTAAYVFDRTHGLDGAFLTFLDLDESDRATNRNDQLIDALARQIQIRIPEEHCPPDPSFPAGRAFACVVLLLIGFGLPDVSGSIDPSTTPDSAETTAGTKRTANRESQLAGTNDGQASVQNNESSRIAKQLINRFERLKNETASENDAAVKRRREGLAKDMRSYLRERHLDDASAVSSDTERTHSTSGASEDTGNSSELSTNTTSGDQTTSDSTGSSSPTSGNNNDSPSATTRSVASDRNRNAANDRQLRTIQLALHQLETTTRPSSDRPSREAPEHRRANDAPAGTPPGDPPTSLASAAEKEPFQLNWSELEESIQRPHQVQSWPPKYDRSISRYRSFLQSFIGSKKENNDAQ